MASEEERWEGIVSMPEFAMVGVTAQFFMVCYENRMLRFVEKGVKTNTVLTANSRPYREQLSWKQLGMYKKLNKTVETLYNFIKKVIVL